MVRLFLGLFKEIDNFLALSAFELDCVVDGDKVDEIGKLLGLLIVGNVVFALLVWDMA